jgi:hypothetical protein
MACSTESLCSLQGEGILERVPKPEQVAISCAIRKVYKRTTAVTEHCPAQLHFVKPSLRSLYETESPCWGGFGETFSATLLYVDLTGFCASR